MFTTIRSKLLVSFLGFGLALIAVPIIIATSLYGMVIRYQEVVNNMISIYEITSLTDDYRDAYLNVIQNVGIEKYEQRFALAEKGLQDSVDNINIVNSQELIVTAQGVVNIVNNILAKGEQGYSAARSKDITLAYDSYESIFEHSLYVKENIGKLSLLELGQIINIQKEIEQDSITIFGLIISSIVLIALTSYIFASVYSKLFTSPLMQLSKSVEDFGNTGYSTAVADKLLKQKDEVGVMARTYESMRKKILAAIEQQKKIQLDLESKNKELVEMNEMMIGRELKMVELKNKLETITNSVTENSDA